MTAPPPVELRAPDASLRIADPEARAMFEAAGAPSATLAPPRSPSRVLVTAMENTAAGEARRAAPVTDMLGSTLPEGGRASATLTLPSGSCTTFVAQGGLGVIETDLFLTDRDDTAPAPVILAADPDSGPIAVIGGAASGCFNAPFNLPVRLTVQVRRGAGPVLVRAFADKR